MAARRKIVQKTLPTRKALRKPSEMTPHEREVELIKFIASCQRDPLKFIVAMWPWRKGPLLNRKPRKWLVRLCDRIKDKLEKNETRQVWEVVQEAVASGHGIGKSAGLAQLLIWAMSTMEHTRGVVTANTGTQLRTKTWPELAKWHSMVSNHHWFNCTATAFFHVLHEKSWRVDAVPWSEHNTESFQGLHNEGKRLFIAMDEASGIANPVWEATEGALTDARTDIIWLAFGNPTRPQGRFRDCFTKQRHLWGVDNVDSRTVDGINLDRIEKWRRLYGEDSQFFKVRVIGEFVDAAHNQLIALTWVVAARDREFDAAKGDGSQPRLRISVDCAAGGDNETVISAAQHYQTRIVVKKMTRHSFELATATVSTANHAEAMFLEQGGRKGIDDFVVDSLGVGVGVAGLLIARDYRVITYQGGASSDAPHLWRCRRVQSYLCLRNEFRDGRIVLDSNMLQEMEDWDELEAQLTSIRTRPTDKLEDLMTKEDMQRMGIDSPDMADNLAMQLATSAPAMVTDPMRDPTQPAPSQVIVSRSTINDGLM